MVLTMETMATHITRRDNLYGNENTTEYRVCVCMYYLNKTTVKY